MKHMVTKVVMALVALVAFGCAGAGEFGETAELAEAEQGIQVIARYGVAHTPASVSNHNGRCRALLNTDNETCIYPPNKTLIAYVNSSPAWSSDDLNLAKAWVETAAGSLNAVTSTWVAGRTGSIGDNPDVIIKRGVIQRNNTGANGTIMSLANVACTTPGATLAEEQTGTHKLCNRYTCTVDTDNVRFYSAAPFGGGTYAEFEALFAHAMHHCVNVAAGIGWQGDGVINGVNHSMFVNALNINPAFFKAGYAPRDVCRADAYNTANPLLLQQVGGCP